VAEQGKLDTKEIPEILQEVEIVAKRTFVNDPF
jgi:hypothetical protein